MSSPSNRFVKAEDPSVARYDPLSAAFAETHENSIEERILELLGDQCALHAKEIGGNRDPFEIAVVKTGKNNSIPRFHCFLNHLEIYDVDIARIIFGRQAGTPEKVDHRPGKVLVGFAHQLGPPRQGECGAERRL